MRRSLLFAMAVLFAAPAFAQVPQSTTQMTLAGSQTFITRLQYALAQQALVVRPESPPASCASQRKEYAAAVIRNSRQVAADAAPIVVGQVNLIGTVVPNADPNLVDSSASDAAILSQVATIWNALSGCTTPGS